MSATDKIFQKFMLETYHELLRLAEENSNNQEEVNIIARKIADRVLELIRDVPTYDNDNSEGMVKEAFTVANETSPSTKQASNDWRPGSFKPRDRTMARKLEILRITLGAGRPVRLDDMMARLEKVGLAQQDKRTTVVTQLTRMRAEEKFIETPYEGNYQITEQGIAFYRKYSAVLTELIVPVDLQ